MLSNHDFNAAIVRDVTHRPWPLPKQPWVMTQTWNDLLFAHWRVPASELRRRVPDAFQLDLFEGEAWIGVVPFFMTNVAPRAVPSVPWLSAFAEINVRTYVRVDDRPGVYFFSLDAERSLAVRAARFLLNLPYYAATIDVRNADARVHYHSRRRSAMDIQFRATYSATGPNEPPRTGTLEYFLTERYCLYHQTRAGAPYRLEIHHPPWPLQAADADIACNTMAVPHGFELTSERPTLHFAKRQDMVAWAPTPLP